MKRIEIDDFAIKIIVAFALIKKYKFDNPEQIEFFISRNIKYTDNLKNYPMNRIIETLKWLQKNANFKYTISTIEKYIDEDLQALEEKAKPKDKRSLELEQAEREKQALKRQQVEFEKRYKIN